MSHSGAAPEPLPPVLVALVVHNSAAVLPGLLASLPAALTGIDRYRLVVADNVSTDDSLGVIGRLAPEAAVVGMPANLGYAAGINACARRGRGDEALLVLNPDVRLAPGSVSALLRACVDDDGLGVAAPVVFGPDGDREVTLRRRPTALRAWGEALLGRRAARWPRLSELVLPERVPRDRQADWVNGAVLLIPAAIRAAVGDWREALFLYGEEVDYCRRVTDAGWQVRQVAAARATHLGGQSRSTPQLWAQLVANKVAHAARWEGGAATRMTWAALVFGQLLRLPLRRGTHRAALCTLWQARRDLLRGATALPAAPAAAVAVLRAGEAARC